MQIYPYIAVATLLLKLKLKYLHLVLFHGQDMGFLKEDTLTQKQPSSGVLRKKCHKNMPQIYRRTPTSKNDLKWNVQSNFIEITFRHGCSPVNLLHFFRTSFPKKTSGWLLLLTILALLSGMWCCGVSIIDVWYCASNMRL